MEPVGSSQLNSIRLGLALGGGGARGLAHIGVLKVLDRAGISVCTICGTSMGGIIGALYAAGIKPEEMELEAKTRSRFSKMISLMDIDASTRPYLFRGNRIHHLLNDWLGEERTFADLKLPFAVTAVDLNTGREVVLSKGRVADAARATMSVPGVFAPVKMGNHRLVDGGVLNNVPVEIARLLGADRVLAVDVLPSFQENRPGEPPVVQPLKARKAPRAYRDLWNIELIMIAEITNRRLRETPPDWLLRPELPVDMDLLIGFDRAQEAIQAGELAAEAVLPQIKAQISNINRDE